MEGKKPGWQTSEFWIMMSSVAAPIFGLPVEPLTAVAGALYAAARSAYKIWG